MTIKAIIFDFDGLILDTETPWYEAFCEIYKEHGAELPMELWGKGVGASYGHFDPYQYLAECTGKAVDRNTIDALFTIKHGALMEQQTIRPGVESYLQAAQQLGLRIGLASSSPRSWVENYLKLYRLLDYFEVIRTADDVTHLKPDPELYLFAAAALDVLPSEVVAFEDSPTGTRAAKAAGMHCVIVPNPVTTQLAFDDYDLRINSMSDISLSDLLEKLGA